MSLLRLSPLVVILGLTGCAFVFNLGGQEGEDFHDTAVDGDSDTDTDTDVDGDSGESDSGNDTALVWTGPFILAATDAYGTADTCTGTVEISVLGGILDGQAQCAFAGGLAGSFSTGLDATLEGADTPESRLIHFEEGLNGTLTWVDGGAKRGVSGTFGGSLETNDQPMTVSGSFQAE